MPSKAGFFFIKLLKPPTMSASSSVATNTRVQAGLGLVKMASPGGA